MAKPPGGGLAPAPAPQVTYGDGEPLPDQALLHTGGNHHVALIRRAGPPGGDGSPAKKRSRRSR
jgi:hypothetical protein